MNWGLGSLTGIRGRIPIGILLGLSEETPRSQGFVASLNPIRPKYVKMIGSEVLRTWRAGIGTTLGVRVYGLRV